MALMKNKICIKNATKCNNNEKLLRFIDFFFLISKFS